MASHRVRDFVSRMLWVFILVPVLALQTVMCAGVLVVASPGLLLRWLYLVLDGATGAHRHFKWVVAAVGIPFMPFAALGLVALEWFREGLPDGLWHVREILVPQPKESVRDRLRASRELYEQVAKIRAAKAASVAPIPIPTAHPTPMDSPSVTPIPVVTTDAIPERSRKLYFVRRDGTEVELGAIVLRFKFEFPPSPNWHRSYANYLLSHDGCIWLPRWQGFGIRLFALHSEQGLNQISAIAQMMPIAQCFTGFWNASTGSLGDTATFEKLCNVLPVPAQKTLIFSDEPSELTAAFHAGFNTCLISIDRSIWSKKHQVVAHFTEMIEGVWRFGTDP